MGHSDSLSTQVKLKEAEIRHRCGSILLQDDVSLGMLMLDHDLLGSKAPRSQLNAWAVEAHDSGYALGRSWSTSRLEPEQVAEHLRIRVDVRNGGVTSRQFLIAQFYTRKRRIVLYRDTIDLVSTLIKILELEQVFPLARLTSIALAHELYHWAEADADGATLRARFRYPSFVLGPVRIYGRVMAATELAAHGFAQGLCDLSRSPALLTVLLASGATILLRP